MVKPDIVKSREMGYGEKNYPNLELLLFSSLFFLKCRNWDISDIVWYFYKIFIKYGKVSHSLKDHIFGNLGIIVKGTTKLFSTCKCRLPFVFCNCLTCFILKSWGKIPQLCTNQWYKVIQYRRHISLHTQKPRLSATKTENTEPNNWITLSNLCFAIV